MGKILDFIKKTTIDIPKEVRIAMAGIAILALTIVGINTYNNAINPKDEQNVDSNIYLNEEVCFAKEIYISVTGINVTKEEESYILHLTTNIEQKCADSKPDKVIIKPKNFVLKSVNLKAKSQMSVFFEALFKASFSIMVSGAVGGDVNLIEETISFVGDYTTDSIDNAKDANTKFKSVKADETFNPFYPRDVEGITTLELTFPISISNLEQTDNIIALTIDQWNHIERRIFLVLRPQQS